MKNIISRSKMLSKLFSYDERVVIEDKQIEIIPVNFIQNFGTKEVADIQCKMPFEEFCSKADNNIMENTNFQYFIINPLGRLHSKRATLLLHGLNERTWDKYLLWAEELVESTGEPVILFPIAFHINRTPRDWFSPRWIMPWASKRREQITNRGSSSFFNYALSARLSACPQRFYVSGKETVFNICQLISEIHSAINPYFAEDTLINLFAYSIGAFLAQILLIANPGNYFGNSKLFTFCGGSVFEDMNGVAKDIMDEKAFGIMHNYYLNSFNANGGDVVEDAFSKMLYSRNGKEWREEFFGLNRSRVKMVTMKKDSVIPTIGALNAVGDKNVSILNEDDFPFQYSHQIPFPINGTVPEPLLNESFNMIFQKAESFLCS